MTDDLIQPDGASGGDAVAAAGGAAPVAPATPDTPVASLAPDASLAPAPSLASDDDALLGLIDRLAALLDRSDLTELEVEAGGTGIVLRKPAALAPALAAPAGSPASATTDGGALATGEPPTAGRDPAASSKPSVKAPLTGIFYASPAPGSGPYVTAGGEVAVGQVIGLIEAMKLFNEIKSDLAGRVVRVVPESGTLVKAKQPLIEVEPL
ncbi:MAG: acetyl-CoA carboxylase biotin carboxyl carrier protein [Chloroflexota bacterium]|nr:acetyl-CoA carboxylase biotin carboxyl carrier protein [Chloroflexota bacterium]